MTILFITGGNALLPEIEAYISFFSQYPGVNTKVAFAKTKDDVPADVEWHFMGMHKQKNNKAVTIHEYASASTPPFANLKNRLKKALNCLPDYRLFYSEYVKDQFNFRDNIPYGYRGHGILEQAGIQTNSEKKYDFIYVGSVDKQRHLSALFNCFTTGSMQCKTLLVLSKNYQIVSAGLTAYNNIIFKGPVPYTEVYKYIRKCRFALNYIPDISPYNQQVSAKFIDYTACGAKIITTDYAWIRQFQKINGGNFFFLTDKLENFSWDNINQFQFVRPELKYYTWENQIVKSGVLDFLQKRFPEMKILRRE